MLMQKNVIITVVALLSFFIGSAQKIKTGAERLNVYLPMLKGKNVAVFANPTSVIGKKHLVDVLLENKVKIVKIFGPEHGFRGGADAGEKVSNTTDKKTGIPIISLYGNNKKPTKEQCKNVDILLFDIQDVGVRFYTYISSLEYYMQAAVENDKQLIILDRPNPNGFYVDGPVLDTKFKSFVGMQNIPIVHGMTVGEYALMLAKEQTIDNTSLFNTTTQINNTEPTTIVTDYLVQPKTAINGSIFLTVITCEGYNHADKYVLPVWPSPNLKSMQAIYMYPSTCFFEGTVCSEGRGTDYPFQIFGHPTLPKTLYAFTPKPNAGAKSSKCFNQKCYGWFVNGTNQTILKQLNGAIDLSYFITAFKQFPGKDSFFLKTNFIDKLAGTDRFAKQILANKTAAEIKATWAPELKVFKEKRKKYLLYKDFE
jgi:uncharacterized protein YbbC (DUF1343 family)